MPAPSFGAAGRTGRVVRGGWGAVVRREPVLVVPRQPGSARCGPGRRFLSDAVHEAARVEQAARVELLFYPAHQPEVVAGPAPDGQGVLPPRRAARQDDVPFGGPGSVVQP